MVRHNLASSAGVALHGANLTWVVVVAVVALLALVVAGVLVREVLAASQGTQKMQEISRAVQEGAAAYLKRQFRTLSVFVVLIFFVLLLLPADTTGVRWGRSVFFLVGALFSALTGFTGMSLTVRGNVRVAAAAKESGERKAMRIAFRTGGVAGMFTVGLGLFGAALVVLIYKGNAPEVLEGFGFGAALLAMFMRVGGGIFTKAADVGADLVGKVEKNIPEDDPRNAATIADNVGDNVGDCAGMAADLFESYAVMLVAALILGKVAFGNYGLVFPLIVPMIGVITAVIGIFVVAPRKGDRSGMTAINRGFFISAVISAILVAVASFTYLPAHFSQLTGVTDRAILRHGGSPQWLAIGAVIIGLVLASAIQLLTGYFTETNRRPVREIARELPDRGGHGHPVGHLDRHGVRGLLRAADRRGGVLRLPARHRERHDRAVRRGAGRDRAADHGGRDRVHGLVRPGDRQRAGHRRDVRRVRGRARPGADPAGRDRQHHQGDHQGHRDRHRRARGHGAVRLVPHHGGDLARQGRRARSACPWTSRTCWSGSSSAPPWCSCSPAC